jgi:hypothetical protein
MNRIPKSYQKSMQAVRNTKTNGICIATNIVKASSSCRSMFRVGNCLGMTDAMLVLVAQES